MRKLYLVCRVSWEDLYYGSYLPHTLKLFSNYKNALKYLNRKLKDSDLWKLKELQLTWKAKTNLTLKIPIILFIATIKITRLTKNEL